MKARATVRRIKRWAAHRIVQPRPRTESGSVTPFVVLMVAALFVSAGLVIDGGYALAAKRKAMNDAEQAARAGADSLSPNQLRSGSRNVSPKLATDAAQRYLSAVGAHGTVQVDGGSVTVTVTDVRDTAILSAFGVNHVDVEASATAHAIDASS